MTAPQPGERLTPAERKSLEWFGPWPRFYADKTAEYHDLCRHAFNIAGALTRILGVDHSGDANKMMPGVGMDGK